MVKLLVIVMVLGLAGEDEMDILGYAASQPRDVIQKQPDGTSRRPKYGDPQLEQAETLLTPLFERPWTVAKVLTWYREARDAKVRAALLRVLAASRDPRAITVLGRALDDSALDVRVAATYGLLDYFLGVAVEGGTEQQMEAARRWWTKYRADLDELQGQWHQGHNEREGKPIPEHILPYFLVIEGSEVAAKRNHRIEGQRWSFKLDPAGMPKAIDRTLLDGPQKGEVQKGIYRLEGRTLTLCFARPGQDRPQDFVARPGDGRMLSVFSKPGRERGQL